MYASELVDERPYRPVPGDVYRPKAIVRHVPLTNGILCGGSHNYRRSYGGSGRVGVRDSADRVTRPVTASTSTSSQYDTETDFTGNECYCDECHRVRVNGQRCYRSVGWRNRYSMPRLGYYGTLNGNSDVNGPNAVPLTDQMGQLRLSGSSGSPRQHGYPGFMGPSGQLGQSGSQRSTLRRRRKNRGCVLLPFKSK